jgi:hypothetical protein
VRVEELLDLPRVDVLAATDDRVLRAADDVRVAVGVDRRQVARVHPAGRVGRLVRPLLVVPAAEHHALSAHPQLARGVQRNGPARRGSTILHSTWGKTRPTVAPRFSSGSSGDDIVETAHVPVMPYAATRSRSSASASSSRPCASS